MLRNNLLITKILALILIAVFYVEAQADKYANAFLGLSLSPSVCGKGNIGSMSGGDYFSAYYNPALISQLGNGVSFTHGDYFSGLLKMDAIGVNWSVKNDNLTFLAIRSAVDKIPDTRNAFMDLNQNGILDPGEFDPTKVTYFSNEDYAFVFAYGGSWKNLDYGVNAKIIYRSLHEEDGYGVGLDLGGLYQYENMIFSVMLKNVTTTIISWSTGKKEYTYPEVIFGQSYVWNDFHEDFALDFQVEEVFFTEDYGKSAIINQGMIHGAFRLGTELRYSNFLFFRLGFDSYDLNETTRFNEFWDESLTFGFGARVKKAKIDYSLQKKAFLKNTHKVSLSWFF